jgi:tRNA G37 N-methylase TrmD
MVMKVEPFVRALEAIRAERALRCGGAVVAQGRRFDQARPCG